MTMRDPRPRWRAEVERLRVVVALQWLHARHDFAGCTRSDPAFLWRGAGLAALLSHYHHDPALLVEVYLAEAISQERKSQQAWRGASADAYRRALRERGLHNIQALRKATVEFTNAGGEKPAEGWQVVYYPWSTDTLQVGTPRVVLLGGGPEQMAKRAEAMRAMQPEDIANLPPGHLYLAAKALKIDGARPPFDHPALAALRQTVLTALLVTA